jgi:hypothetical protein
MSDAASRPVGRLAQARKRCGSALLLAALWGACTPPQYYGDEDTGTRGHEPSADPDAGSDVALAQEASVTLCEGTACATSPSEAGAAENVPEDAAADAEPRLAPEAGLDPIRGTWVGRYATRSYLFAWDAPLETHARFLTLAEIKPTADGGLVLEEELCLFDGEWSFFVTAQLRVLYADSRLSAPLQFDAEGFSAMPARALVGYSAQASQCSEGASTAQAEPYQVWLPNQVCDCPRTDALPTSVRDCRLTDADHDQKPGFTFSATGAGTTVTYHVAQEERLRLLNGYRVDQRLYADREFSHVTTIVGCVIDGTTKRPDECALGRSATCPAEHNKVELVPIAPGLGCRQIIERETGLFQVPMPSFPSRCKN